MSAALPGAAGAAAFPLGGIGTGNVSLGARGELRDWEIRNRPAKRTSLPGTFFSVHVARADGLRVSRILESRLRPPFERDHGYPAASLAGLPRLRASTLRGEYPIATVDFEDDELPVEVSLEAYTPLVPLDSEDSALPAAVLRYRVRNPTAAAVDVTVAGSLFNAVGWTPRSSGDPTAAEIAGDPVNEFRRDGPAAGLWFTSTLPSDDLQAGSMALTTRGADPTARPSWSTGPVSRALGRLWDDLCAGRPLAPQPDTARDDTAVAMAVESGASPTLIDALQRMEDDAVRHRAGTLTSSASVGAGAEAVFEFVLAWYFPNRPRAWTGWTLDNTNAHEVVRNHYATRFADAWDVARYVDVHRDRLDEATRSFRESLHGSRLPAAVVDAVATGVATLRSTTCFRLADGTFAAWEGSDDTAGSCEGTCTHVWNYAQTAAFLFPDLERSARRCDFLLETDAEGAMSFRGNALFGGAPWNFLPAADGQLGTIVRLHREWAVGGDDGFLRELWPAAVRALDHALRTWDPDGDLVLEARQHNTYDTEFYGANPYTASLLCAALHAMARMADHLGETDGGRRYRHAAGVAAERADTALWNGEYYEQAASGVAGRRNQFGPGCLSDQVFGQFLAHVTGLGHVLPVGHVRDAVRAVARHNLRPTLAGQVNPSRTYALEDDAGLVLCSWPRGGRPDDPFLYCDEVWSGVEYQVAAHLAYEGELGDALRIVEAVRRRHDGYRRNPWNEVEAGNHYARSMASWALLLAWCGFGYHAPDAALRIVPPRETLDRGAACFFSAGTAWGRLDCTPDSLALDVRAGTFGLRRLTVHAGAGGARPGLILNGTGVETSGPAVEGPGVRTFALPELRVRAGDRLVVQPVHS